MTNYKYGREQNISQEEPTIIPKGSEDFLTKIHGKKPQTDTENLELHLKFPRSKETKYDNK